MYRDVAETVNFDANIAEGLAFIASSKTLETVDEAHIEEDDSESDDKTDTNKPDHLDLIDDKKDNADDKSEQENMNE